MIFVPGILGSELHDPDTRQVVWGAFWSGPSWDETLRAFALPYTYEGPVGEIRDTIVPGGQLMTVVVRHGQQATQRLRCIAVSDDAQPILR